MEQKQGSTFVTEIVKERPVNKKKLFRRTISTVAFAIIFGLIACLTFFFMEPIINNILNPEKITKVKFPEEKQELKPEELLTEESMAQQEESIQEVVEAAKEVVKSGQEPDASIAEYEKTYSQLQSLAKNASKAIVTVIGISEQQDWFAGTTENQNTTAGLIVAENGVELLILADANNLENAQEYHIRFSDKKTISAQLKERDSQTGLAVYAVKLSDVPKETAKEAMAIAVLGSSASENIVGSPAITIGAPFGTVGSMSYGMVTSNGKKLSLADAVYNLVLTDMSRTSNASGAVINMQGEVIGFVTQSADVVSDSDTISALGISDIKTMIAKLSNDEKRAYIGIKGMDVSEDAHAETGVPYGVYVTEVLTESPAMAAGIQNGDVIVAVSGNKVTSFREFRAGIFSLQPETITEITLMRFNGTEYNEIKIELTTGEAK
jgi:serine protease Do